MVNTPASKWSEGYKTKNTSQFCIFEIVTLNIANLLC